MNARLIKLAVALGFTVAIGLPSAFAAGEKGSADVSKFKDEIQKQTQLSESDISAIEPQLREFSQRDASPDKVAGLTKDAVDNNCTGPCLRDVLSSMNSAMAKGLSADDAQNMVSTALRDQVQARGGAIADPSELGNQVRASVDSQLAGRPATDSGMSGGTTGGTMGGTDSGTMGTGGQTGGTPSGPAGGTSNY